MASDIKLYTRDGSECEYTNVGRNLIKKGTFYSTSISTLNPGESVTHEMDLKKYFRIRPFKSYFMDVDCKVRNNEAHFSVSIVGAKVRF